MNKNTLDGKPYYVTYSQQVWITVTIDFDAKNNEEAKRIAKDILNDVTFIGEIDHYSHDFEDFDIQFEPLDDWSLDEFAVKNLDGNWETLNM